MTSQTFFLESKSHLNLVLGMAICEPWLEIIAVEVVSTFFHFTMTLCFATGQVTQAEQNRHVL